MFTSTQGSSDRLAVWRKLRQDNNSAELETLLESFSQIKLLPRYIDFYTPKSWPNVFDIVSEGYFCQSGVSLVLAATLYHKKIINTETIQFDAISNHVNGVEGLVIVDGDDCYNFYRDRVVPVSYMRKNSVCYASHIITIDKLFD